VNTKNILLIEDDEDQIRLALRASASTEWWRR
jgi:hypothetical protein